MKTKKDVATRFWDKVEKRLYGCWPWTACKDRDGYGVFRFDNSHGWYRSNRVAWMLCFGEIPPKKLVLHSCNNTSCCNPDHLVLGTQKDNMAYASKCGRMAPRTGTSNGRSTLTDDDVRWIRAKIRTHGRGTAAALAKRFGLHRMTIYRIAWGQLWKHLL